MINCPTTIGFLCTIKLFWQFRRLIYNYMTTLPAVCLVAVERIAPVVAGPFTDLITICGFPKIPRIILAMSIFDISSRFRYYRFRRGSVKQCLLLPRNVRYMDPFPYAEAVTVYGYGFAAQRMGNTFGNELFFMLVRPVIITASCDYRRHSACY